MSREHMRQGLVPGWMDVPNSFLELGRRDVLQSLENCPEAR